MKKIVSGLLVLLCTASVNPTRGQSPVSGTATYESENLSRMNMGGQQLEQRMNLSLSLDFSGKYCRVTALLGVGPQEIGGGGLKLNGIPPQQKYYVPGDKAFYQLTQAKGKIYAIRSEPKDITDLSITGRKDTIFGYTCHEFTYKSNGELVTGWYTPDLPAIVAPHEVTGVPGGILKIESKNYNSMVTSIKVGTTVSEADLKLPANSIKISNVDFAKEMVGNR
ncbi:MAG TPA: GLPGLI family protein [Chitinophagaceae bacterium]|jgi:GLPGLI family protein|nr:GLPGLI family protein [Chitinophagaceae bacterium]